MTYVLGQTSVFPWLCKKLPLKMPCLDGTWEGELKSNWPKIAERCDLKTENLKPTPVTVIVIVRLLFIKVILNSDSGYSNSKTLAVSIKRDKETGLVELCYIYDNTTKAPENTDSSQHYGAACLSLTKHDETLVLDGVYWTNRNWQNAMNTAGILTLKKSKNS